MADLGSALKALNDSLPTYAEAADFYEGTADEKFVSDKIRRVIGDTGSDFRINYARIPIRSRLSRLEINSVTGETDDVTELIGEIWERNVLAQEAHDIHEQTLEFGETYAIVWPTEDETSVDIFLNSPDTCRIFYSTENPRVKAYAMKRWSENGYIRVDLLYPDRIEKYISIAESGTRLNDLDYEPYTDEEGDTWPYENPFGEIPVFHFRTSRPYGRPEHADAFGPQAMLNKLIVTQMATVETQGWPARYVLQDPSMDAGTASADLDFGATPDSLGVVDDDDDETISAGPADLAIIRNAKMVGQFTAADPNVFLQPLTAYVRSMAAATDTPIHLFEGGSAPSGEALRVAEAPLVKRVQDLQLVLGATWQELFRFALRTLNVESGVALTWKPAASYDDTDQWTSAKAQQEAGVPVVQTLLERGYTAEQIEDFGPILNPSGDPTKLAAAMTLGLITEDEARAAMGFAPRGEQIG